MMFPKFSMFDGALINLSTVNYVSRDGAEVSIKFDGEEEAGNWTFKTEGAAESAMNELIAAAFGHEPPMKS